MPLNPRIICVRDSFVEMEDIDEAVPRRNLADDLEYYANAMEDVQELPPPPRPVETFNEPDSDDNLPLLLPYLERQDAY